MFIGRDKELARLNKLYNSDKFEFVIMYGRRRIGKTTLLKEFAKDKNVIFYSAIENRNNLDMFSQIVFDHFNEQANMSFSKWNDSFMYISNHINEKTVLIIDEFPYIAKYEPEVKSFLQHMIDHYFINQKIMIILCGSSVSFMLNDVMGEKSPLYARNSNVMEIQPIGYKYVKDFLPNFSNEDLIMSYGIFGGIPYYLSLLNKDKSLYDNIIDLIIDDSGKLRDEPITLLRAELREPSIYNTILSVISNGANKLTEISDKTKIPVTELPYYLTTLIEMRIVSKIICVSEKENSKKSQYIISDNYFNFWYHFIHQKQTTIELSSPEYYLSTIKKQISDHLGFQFENICKQYIIEKSQKGRLPFIPNMIGKWWGNNPVSKEQTDIDILANKDDKYIICECKFRNETFDLSDLNKVISSKNIFKDGKEFYYYLFVKSSFSSKAIEKSKEYNVKLITINEMF